MGQVSYLKIWKIQMQPNMQTLEWRKSSNGICVTIEMTRCQKYWNVFKSVELTKIKPAYQMVDVLHYKMIILIPIQWTVGNFFLKLLD